MQLPCEVTEEFDVFALLQQTALFLWKDWPKDMELSSVKEDNSGVSGFTIHGECPHCSPTRSAFTTVTRPFDTQYNGAPYVIAVARCIACREFILAALKYGQRVYGRGNEWMYALHYPLGKPDETVSEHIPEAVRLDFQEALRCQFVNAHSATVEMCRRAIESSCLNLGAPFDQVLENMIDWLEAQRTITPTLKDVAHKVRLSGNRGAHPWKVGEPIAEPVPIVVIEKEHAEAVVSFTRHFLEHVYVIPSKLPQFDFSKPKAPK
jgi:Domain of unknown function (DUF4145)